MPASLRSDSNSKLFDVAHFQPERSPIFSGIRSPAGITEEQLKLHKDTIPIRFKCTIVNIHTLGFIGRRLANRLQGSVMRILAIFDHSEAAARLEMLRSNRHVVTLVSSCTDGLELLQEQSYDLILCEVFFENDDCNVFEFLKEIRKQSDIPLICCRVETSIIEKPIDSIFVKTLPLLGGQGFIDSNTFHSKRFLQAIEKSLSSAVGSSCTVAPLYVHKPKQKTHEA